MPLGDSAHTCEGHAVPLTIWECLSLPSHCSRRPLRLAAAAFRVVRAVATLLSRAICLCAVSSNEHFAVNSLARQQNIEVGANICLYVNPFELISVAESVEEHFRHFIALYNVTPHAKFIELLVKIGRSAVYPLT